MFSVDSKVKMKNNLFEKLTISVDSIINIFCKGTQNKLWNNTISGFFVHNQLDNIFIQTIYLKNMFLWVGSVNTLVGLLLLQFF